MKSSLKFLFFLLLLVAFPVLTLAQADDQVTTADLSSAKVNSMAVAPRGHRNGQDHARFGIPGIDSLVNFNKHFRASGVDGSGNPQVIWYYNMVGNPPEMGWNNVVPRPSGSG